MLKGQRRELPDPVAAFAEMFAMAIGRADEKGDGFDVAAEFPLGEGIGPLLGGESLAAFIQSDAEMALAAIEKLGGDAFRTA